jgi:uncharacterized membrane protein
VSGWTSDWRVSVAVAVVFWGLWGFFSKVAITRLGWPTATMIGWAAGVVVVGPFLASEFRWTGLANAWPALIYGASGALGAVFLFKALAQGPASVVLPLSEGWVVVAVLLATIFLGERLSWSQMVGLAMLLIGVGLLARE